jgi:hypothetical protein
MAVRATSLAFGQGEMIRVTANLHGYRLTIDAASSADGVTAAERSAT